MTNKERFLEICKTKIKREGLDKLLDWLEKSDFYEAPASTKYHGNFAGGLLEHSLNVYDCIVRVAANYPDKHSQRLKYQGTQAGKITQAEAD